MTTFYVAAKWDPEAEVWYSETDIPGLVIEAGTLKEFEELMVALAPEMIAENVPLGKVKVGVDFRTEQRREFELA